jgi:outer membrane protein assembly factor BamB
LLRYLAPEDYLGAGIWSTPAVDTARHLVYVTTGTGDQDAEVGNWGGSMLALDATTLEISSYFFLPTNSSENDIEWGSSPMLFSAAGTPLVAATGKDGILYAQYRDDLSPVWQSELALSCICPECGCGSLSTPAFDGKLLYVGAGAAPDADLENGSVYSINPASGQIVWKVLLEGAVIAPVAVANGVVFVSTTMGLQIFRADTGEWLADSGPRSPIYSQPVVVDGVLYVTYVSGDVIAFRPHP